MGGIQLQHGTLLVPENSTSPQHGRGSPPGETLSHSPAHPALGDRCVTGLSWLTVPGLGLRTQV